MKKIFNKDVLKAVAFAVIGFVCGSFVDSTIFHINPIFCGAFASYWYWLSKLACRNYFACFLSSRNYEGSLLKKTQSKKLKGSDALERLTRVRPSFFDKFGNFIS